MPTRRRRPVQPLLAPEPAHGGLDQMIMIPACCLAVERVDLLPREARVLGGPSAQAKNHEGIAVMPSQLNRAPALGENLTIIGRASPIQRPHRRPLWPSLRRLSGRYFRRPTALPCCGTSAASCLHRRPWTDAAEQGAPALEAEYATPIRICVGARFSLLTRCISLCLSTSTLRPTSVDPTRNPIAEVRRRRRGKVTPAIGCKAPSAGSDADQVETAQILRHDHEVAPVRDTQCPTILFLRRGAAGPQQPEIFHMFRAKAVPVDALCFFEPPCHGVRVHRVCHTCALDPLNPTYSLNLFFCQRIRNRIVSVCQKTP